MNLVLLAKALGAADEFNLQPVLLREALGVFSWSLSQRLCPLRVVKDANVMGVEIRRHPFRITQARQGAESTGGRSRKARRRSARSGARSIVVIPSGSRPPRWDHSTRHPEPVWFRLSRVRLYSKGYVQDVELPAGV